MELTWGAEEEHRASRALEALERFAYLPLVGLHPGAGGAWKRWPPSHFIELGRRLVAERGCQVIVTGSERERGLTEQVAAAIPGAVPIFSLSLLSFAALLKQMDLLVAGDTGPLHLAAALQLPALGLFSPTSDSGSRCSISRAPTCIPCLKERCQDPFCLRQIGVEEVYQKALARLQE
jgi:ADP-heptose:LPS heptosyltransferase